MFVQADGITKVNVASLENIKTKDYGVRPCLWISLEDADNKLTITGKIPKEWKSENTPWGEFKDTVEKIGGHAFDGCSPELVIIYMGNEYTANTIEDAVENK